MSSRLINSYWNCWDITCAPQYNVHRKMPNNKETLTIIITVCVFVTCNLKEIKISKGFQRLVADIVVLYVLLITVNSF